MAPFRSRIGRRSVALALAYLLALQALLSAWAVLLSGATAADAFAVLCLSHAGKAVPQPDQPPATCPCGPLCHGNGSANGAAPPVAASLPAYRAVAVAPARLPEQAPPPRRTASEPEQARAPPVLA